MFFKGIAVWMGSFGVLGVRAICPTNITDYTVASQADADKFNLCETFSGTIVVAPQNATNLISIPGVKHVTGDIIIGAQKLSPDRFNMSVLSMQSLVSVGGHLSVGLIPDLVTLDLPALSSVGQSFDIFENPSLSTINLPNLTTVGTLDISDLPSLMDLNFESGIRNMSGYTITGPGNYSNYFPSQFTIHNTALISLEGLLFHDVGGLSISDNALENLTLSLESVTCATDDDLAFEISGNNKMNLSLSNLTTLNCNNIVLGNLLALNIPALRFVNGSMTIHTDSLSVFDAPSLTNVTEDLMFEDGNAMQFNLPVLQTIGRYLYVSDNPAIYVENGIYLPQLVNAGSLLIMPKDGTQPYCQILDNMRCRGIFNGHQYDCSGDEVAIDSDPNNCQYTYPAYGWTRVKKLAVGLGVSLGPLVILGFIWLIKNQVKIHKALAAELRALDNVELASTEQLPKYSQHDDDSGVIPPYEGDDAHETAPDRMPDSPADTMSSNTQEEGRNESHEVEPATLSVSDSESVPVSPLEETPDLLDSTHRVPQDEA